MEGEPIVMDTKKNISEIRILFSGQTVIIEKEELAYPFITMMADFGGVLGLFIGFNFLMIWGVAMDLFTKYKSSH